MTTTCEDWKWHSFSPCKLALPTVFIIVIALLYTFPEGRSEPLPQLTHALDTLLKSIAPGKEPATATKSTKRTTKRPSPIGSSSSEEAPTTKSPPTRHSTAKTLATTTTRKSLATTTDTVKPTTKRGTTTTTPKPVEVPILTSILVDDTTSTVKDGEGNSSSSSGSFAGSTTPSSSGSGGQQGRSFAVDKNVNVTADGATSAPTEVPTTLEPDTDPDVIADNLIMTQMEQTNFGFLFGPGRKDLKNSTTKLPAFEDKRNRTDPVSGTT